MPALLKRCLFNCYYYNFSTSGKNSLRELLAIDRFVPPAEQPRDTDAYLLANFLDAHRSILVLTGAGISTESGIPDYRSEHVGLYSRSSQRPMMFSEFLVSPSARQRYWARNFVAWPNFSNRKPNEGHIAVRTLQQLGKVQYY